MEASLVERVQYIRRTSSHHSLSHQILRGDGLERNAGERVVRGNCNWWWEDVVRHNFFHWSVEGTHWIAWQHSCFIAATNQLLPLESLSIHKAFSGPNVIKWTKTMDGGLRLVDCGILRGPQWNKKCAWILCEDGGGRQLQAVEGKLCSWGVHIDWEAGCSKIIIRKTNYIIACMALDIVAFHPFHLRKPHM